MYCKINILSKTVLTLIIFFQIIGYEKMSHFFYPNDQVEIRRAYLQSGFCQLLGHDFPKKEINGVLC